MNSDFVSLNNKAHAKISIGNIMKNSSYKSAFTVVEMLIIVPMVILVIGIFINVIVSMTGEVLSTRASNNMAYNIQDALDKIKQDVSLSGGFLATNNISLVSPQGLNNDTTTFKNSDATTGTMLILNSYTTTNNPSNANRNIVYASSQPNQCNSILYTKNAQVMFNIIYFTRVNADGTTSLWRRTVAPNNYLSVSCSTPWQQPSCTPGQTGVQCKTNDIKLVDNIVEGTGFQINYFAGTNSTIPISDAVDSTKNDSTRQTAINTANTIEVTITANNTVSGKEISQTGKTRVSGLNNNIAATTLPAACPSGFIRVPGSITYGTSDFCVMKYEAKQASATVPISTPTDLPWVSITQTNAIAYAPNVAGCTGCHLISEAEWMTIAQNVLSVPSNWSGGAVGSGYIYSGHNDGTPAAALAADASDSNVYSGTGQSSPSNQRRTLTLTNNEVIWDFAGNVWEWTAGQTTGGHPAGMASWTWYEWTAVSGGTFAVNPFPSSIGDSNSNTWNSAQGVGRIWGLTIDATLRGFMHGGAWNNNITAGVLALALDGQPSASAGDVGFRASR